MRSHTQIAFKAVADATAKGAFFLVVVLAARALGAEDFGRFSLAWTLGWILGVGSDAGLSLHLAREVARRPLAAAAVFGSCLRWRLALTVAAVAIAGVLVAAGFGGASPLAFFAIVIAQLAASQTDFVVHLFRGLSRTEVESALTLAGRLVMLATVSAALWWRPDLAALAVALVATTTLTLGATLVLASRIVGSGSNASTAGACSLRPPQFARDVLPIGVAVLLSAAYFRIDVFLIQHWHGAAAVGLYSAVFRIVEAARLLPAAALAVWFPDLCRASDRAPLARASWMLVGAGIAIAALAYPAAGWLTEFTYGAAFRPASPAFAILLLSLPLLFVNYALTHQLVGWNRQGRFAQLSAVALAVNLALNIWLVPAQGLIGAAWATLATEIVVAAGALAALASGPAWAERVVLGEAAS